MSSMRAAVMNCRLATNRGLVFDTLRFSEAVACVVDDGCMVSNDLSRS